MPKFKCCIKNCKGGEKRYRFPENYKEKWCAILKWSPSQLKDTHRVCELHFDTFLMCKKRLKKGAMPTRMLGPHYDPIHLNAALKSNEALQTRFDDEENFDLVSCEEVCCVVNCEGGDRKFPFSSENMERWCEILNIDPLLVDDTYRICELHFDDSLIGETSLLEGAMPTYRLGDDYDPIYLDESFKSDEAKQDKQNFDYEENSVLDSPQPKCCSPNCENRQSRINDLHQQEELILILEDRPSVPLKDEQHRRLFIRDQKARVLRQLRELGAESILLQQFLSVSSRNNQ